MRCDEYIGPATGTGQRRQCSREALYLARNNWSSQGDDGPDEEVALCGHHVRDYRQSRRWLVIELLRRK